MLIQNVFSLLSSFVTERTLDGPLKTTSNERGWLKHFYVDQPAKQIALLIINFFN